MIEGPRNKPKAVQIEDLVKGPIKKKLIELARSGISYLDLAKIAKGEIIDRDPSHDFSHTMRVLHLAENIAKEIGVEWGKRFDMNVL